MKPALNCRPEVFAVLSKSSNALFLMLNININETKITNKDTENLVLTDPLLINFNVVG